MEYQYRPALVAIPRTAALDERRGPADGPGRLEVAKLDPVVFDGRRGSSWHDRLGRSPGGHHRGHGESARGGLVGVSNHRGGTSRAYRDGRRGGSRGYSPRNPGRRSGSGAQPERDQDELPGARSDLAALARPGQNTWRTQHTTGFGTQ